MHSQIEFCVHLVEFADDVTDDVLHPFLRKHIEETPEQYPLEKVLCKLSRPYLSKWYPRQIVRREEREKKTLEWNRGRVKEGKKVYDESLVGLIWPGTSIFHRDELKASKPLKYGEPSVPSQNKQ